MKGLITINIILIILLVLNTYVISQTIETLGNAILTLADQIRIINDVLDIN